MAAQKPANPRLWALIVTQARGKFRVYPSPAAAHWVHSEYVRKGGRFLGGDKRR